MVNLVRKILRFLLPKFLKEKIKLFYWKTSGNYLTSKILGTKEEYISLFNAAKANSSVEVDNFIIKNNLNAIDQDFLNKLALLTQVSIKKSKIDFQHGKILYSILDKYVQIKKDKYREFNFIDIGTARGFSSIIISKACTDNNINFNIYSFDIIPHDDQIFWNSISDLDGKKTRRVLLKDYSNFMKNIEYITGSTKEKLFDLKINRVNFAFVDGSHDYDDVFFEYEFIKKRQKKDDIIIFDDVTPGYFNDVVKIVEYIKFEAIYDIQLISSSSQRGYAIATRKFD